jgi:hypothetical protein
MDPLAPFLIHSTSDPKNMASCYETAVFIEVLVPLIGKGEGGRTELLTVFGCCQRKLASIDAFTVPQELMKPVALWTRMLNYIGKCLAELDVSPDYLAPGEG